MTRTNIVYHDKENQFEYANGFKLRGNTRIAYRNDNDTEWHICVGKRGGDFRKYKTIEAMDKQMEKIGFIRIEKLKEVKINEKV